MSSYVNFYLRVNDTFAPIGSYSRNNKMYEYMDCYCPYEKIRPFTVDDFIEIINSLKDNKHNIKQARKTEKKHYTAIIQANNSVEEKLNALYESESSLKEMDKEIAEINFTINTLQIFCNMIDDFKYSTSDFSNDYNHYIYAGIEACGDINSVTE